MTAARPRTENEAIGGREPTVRPESVDERYSVPRRPARAEAVIRELPGPVSSYSGAVETIDIGGPPAP